MILAIASGKGGTGKTTLAVNLASVWGAPVQLLDCDVEEPNAHLFLPGRTLREEVCAIPIPQVDAALCDGCGACSRLCAFHAIAVAGATALVFPELCHGCGGCAMICPRHALREMPHRIGVVATCQAGPITLVQGKLDIGVPTATPLIRAVRRQLRPGMAAILDAPPGASCPVVAAVRGADLVLLVTEPTPFGLHDLTLAVEMLRQLATPFGVVINRIGIGDDRVHAFCDREEIPLLAEIPDDRAIAEAYCRGDLIVEALPRYRSLFEDLRDKVAEILKPAGV
ncbi:4Fe-4S binding protein [bacterium]|nr:4Fe-4S binding protein [bacterium]